MKEKFELSSDSIKKLETIQARLSNMESNELAVNSANSCTCCWGGWCANGCTG